MRLYFDIDAAGSVSVFLSTISENEDLDTLSQISIEHPIRDIFRLKDNGAYEHLTEEQFQTLLDKAFAVEKFFNHPTTLCRFLEQIVESYVNMDDEEGELEDE